MINKVFGFVVVTAADKRRGRPSLVQAAALLGCGSIYRMSYSTVPWQHLDKLPHDAPPLPPHLLKNTVLLNTCLEHKFKYVINITKFWLEFTETRTLKCVMSKCQIEYSWWSIAFCICVRLEKMGFWTHKISWLRFDCTSEINN